MLPAGLLPAVGAACCWSCCYCCTCCCCGCSSSLTAVVLTLAPVASALAALAPFVADPRSKPAPALLTEAHSFLKAIAPASVALIKLGGSLLK